MLQGRMSGLTKISNEHFLLLNSISTIMAEKLYDMRTARLLIGISELIETKED